MDAIKLSVEIKEDRRLIINLPPDTPLGTAELTIQPHSNPQPVSTALTTNPAREAARAKLLAAGALSATQYAPPDAVALPEEELQRLGDLFSKGRSSDDLINEDRGEY